MRNIQGSLTRFVSGFWKRPVRPRKRSAPRAIPRRFDLLEEKQLLSSLAPHEVHLNSLLAHHPAHVDSKFTQKHAPRVSYYPAANTTDQSTLPVSGWQGIRGGDAPGQYLITGTSQTSGLLYIGAINGQGTSYAVNYPGAFNSSIYGPNNLGGGQFQLVGTYKPQNSTNVDSFLFQGTTSGGSLVGNYSPIVYPGNPYTYVHSVMGGLAVGNTESPARNGLPYGPGTAFIYNVNTSQFVTNIRFPRSISNTAYGIWYNGGTSYTIVGGFSNRAVNNMQDQSAPIGTAYMVDYNSAVGAHGHFSHWKSFKYPNGMNLLTHFQGISSSAPGVYELSADSVQLGKANFTQGSWVVVKRNHNGTFGNAHWLDLHYPREKGLTSNDSVFGNNVVGFVLGSSGAFSYQATVHVPAPRS